MPHRILIVEDEPSIAENIIYALRTEGYDPVWHSSGQEALDELAATSVALAIVDIGLPDMNGFDLFRRIRLGSALPVIFVTSRADEVDRVAGLEMGADDYVVKPFSPRELTARVRTVLRRTDKNVATQASSTSKPKTFGPFGVDDARHSISYHGQALTLTRYEFRLLKLLVEHPGRVFSRDELMDRVWEEPEMSLDRTVDTHIKTLRAKLGAIRPGEDPIVTHRGVGYSVVY